MKQSKRQKLYDAFDLFAQQQNALLPNEETIATMTLSTNFKERMQLLLRRQKYGFYVLFGTTGRRVASILLAVITAAAVTTVSVEALREPVFQFFTEVFEKFTQILFVDDTPKTPQAELEKRTPTYIPEGYTVEAEVSTTTVYKIVYSNTNGSKVRYSQYSKPNMQVQADTEEMQYTGITIGGQQGITYNNKGTTTITFSDNRHTYVLSGNIANAELIKMAESLIL